MIDEIGVSAGEIWAELEGNAQGLTLEQLKRKIKLPADLFFMGVGWLAREDKLQFIETQSTVRVSLK